ncbi:MAG: TetR/AcrR family transcriptional regulator [Ilumatobacteraceae bacterium]
MNDAATDAISGGDSPETPRRGRPRSVEADQAILAATLDLASEVGISGMSMDDVAHRAGVSKATIYRRWCSKEALVLDALSGAVMPFDDVDTGTLDGDLDLYIGELIRRFGNPMNDVLPHLIEVSCHDDTIRSSLDDYTRVRRVPLSTMLGRAVERGELPPGTDIDVTIDTLIGAFVYRRLLSHDTIDDAFAERLRAIVFPPG